MVEGLAKPPGQEHVMNPQECCAAKVTLNGQPAKVTGARNEYATVRQIGSGLAAEWSWQSAALVISKGGAFQS